jgi:hypothetical protein
MWPTRKVQPAGEAPCLLAAGLKKQADAIAAALKT